MCFLNGSPLPALALFSSVGSQSAAPSRIAGALSILSSNNVLIWCTHGCLAHSANSSSASCISHLTDCQVFHFLFMWLYHYHLSSPPKNLQKGEEKGENSAEIQPCLSFHTRASVRLIRLWMHWWQPCRRRPALNLQLPPEQGFKMSTPRVTAGRALPGAQARCWTAAACSESPLPLPLPPRSNLMVPVLCFSSSNFYDSLGTLPGAPLLPPSASACPHPPIFFFLSLTVQP